MINPISFTYGQLWNPKLINILMSKVRITGVKWNESVLKLGTLELTCSLMGCLIIYVAFLENSKILCLVQDLESDYTGLVVIVYHNIF